MHQHVPKSITTDQSTTNKHKNSSTRLNEGNKQHWHNQQYLKSQSRSTLEVAGSSANTTKNRPKRSCNIGDPPINPMRTHTSLLLQARTKHAKAHTWSVAPNNPYLVFFQNSNSLSTTETSYSLLEKQKWPALTPKRGILHTIGTMNQRSNKSIKAIGGEKSFKKVIFVNLYTSKILPFFTMASSEINPQNQMGHCGKRTSKSNRLCRPNSGRFFTESMSHEPFHQNGTDFHADTWKKAPFHHGNQLQ